MGNIDDFRAKQQELLDAEEGYRKTQKELDNKANELENARRENEDKKTELIEELMAEIATLREREEEYKQQIESIKNALATLHENFNNNQNISGQAAIESVSGQAATESEDSTDQQSESEDSTDQQSKPEDSTDQQSKPEDSTDQQSKPEDSTDQQSKPEDSTDQQSKPEEITDGNPSSYSIESIKQIDIHTYEGFLLAIDKSLEEIKNMKKGTSKRGLPESGKRTMKDAKSKLKHYEGILKKKKKAIMKEKKVNDNDITTLQNIFTQLGKIDYDIHKGQWGEYSNTAGYPYNSPEIARKSNKSQMDDLQFNQDFQKELREGAISTISNGDIQKTNVFLRRIAQREYDEADYLIYRRPSLNQGNGGRILLLNGGREVSPKAVRKSVDYSNMDFGEAFQQGGLAGIVDKALNSCNNLTPGQRNTWKSLAVLGGYAAGIYGLYKFFTNKNMGFWSKAGLTAAAILGSQIATGEGPISLFNKLMTGGFTKEYLEDKFGNAFGDAVEGVHNSSIEGAENISGAMYSLMVFNKTTKVGEVRTLSTRFKNNRQEWTLFCGKAKENLGTRTFERFSAVFSENFDEDKWNSWLNSIGIHDGIDDNKLVYELATVKTMNAIVINKFLSDNGVKVKNNKKEEYEQYVKSMNDNNQAIDISTLEIHRSDRFEENDEATFTDREEDIQNRKALEIQVEQLSLDDQTKSELKKGVQLFYDERPIKNKPNVNDFRLEMDNNLLVLKNRNGEATKINLQDKTLTGFGHSGRNTYEIRFTKTKELLDTAYLTNDILAKQKNKQIANIPPFQYKRERKGICFNDAETLSFNFDTRILSTGRGGATSKIETLHNNPGPYADYLSERWIEENKINIDSTLYPTVKALSDTGIDFFNEQEVKDLEDWLKAIKEGQKFSVGTTNGEPYRVSRRFTSLSNKLVFTAVNGDDTVFQEDLSAKFPTIMRKDNQTKFEKFMNNKDNGMRGSAIN